MWLLYVHYKYHHQNNRTIRGWIVKQTLQWSRVELGCFLCTIGIIVNIHIIYPMLLLFMYCNALFSIYTQIHRYVILSVLPTTYHRHVHTTQHSGIWVTNLFIFFLTKNLSIPLIFILELFFFFLSIKIFLHQ